MEALSDTIFTWVLIPEDHLPDVLQIIPDLDSPDVSNVQLMVVFVLEAPVVVVRVDSDVPIGEQEGQDEFLTRSINPRI